ncbi:MAG: gliding motility-associated C-terminal domain-containing protein [Chitinophagaceae bacterium]
MRIRISFFVILSVMLFSRVDLNAQLKINYQCEGGSEFIVKHRPDINDSTYQFFLRRTGATPYYFQGYGYYGGISNWMSLKDTCGYFLISFNIPFLVNNPPLSLNPFTGDSAGKRIFKVCGNGFPDTTIVGQNVMPSFRDTFELMKDYWYDTIVTLPEKCGKWQLRNSYGSIYNYQCGPDNSSIGINTNLDTAFAPTPGPDFNDINAMIQFNPFVSNESPHFLSQPTAIAIKGQPFFYAMNAVDPEQDSLVFSSVSAIGIVDTSIEILKSDKFIPSCRSIDFSIIPFDTTYRGLFPCKYACIPSTNCIKFNPESNPFDTDSTFTIDPKTGDIQFIAQSAFQSAMVYVKYDEYRNGVWLGTGYREIKFLIFDNSYYQTPEIKIDSIGLINCSLNDSLSVTTCGGPISIPFSCNALAPATLNVSDNHGVSLPGSTISYNGLQTNTVNGIINWTPPASATGVYNLYITVFDSVCSLTPYIYSHSYVLKINVSPGANAGKDTVICEGSTVQLAGTSTSMQNLQWNILYGTPNSLSCQNCLNPIASPTSTSAYEVVYTGIPLSNCKLRDTILVQVQKNFGIMNLDTTLCGIHNLISITANCTIDTNGILFSWIPTTNIIGNPNRAKINLIPSNITYTVVAQDTNNCFTKNAQLSILYDSLFTPSLTISPSNGICTGDTLKLEVNGNFSTNWQPNYNISSISGNNVYVWPDTSVQYTASVNSLISTCKSSISELIQVTALRADAGKDQELFDGESATIGGPNMLCSNGCSFSWFSTGGPFANYLLFPKVRPDGTTTFWVFLTDGSGNCIDRDTVTVFVKCTDLYMPNAFNPHSLNSIATQTFGPNNVSIDLEYFRIFNRWGQQVFYTNNVSERWDGKFNGEPQPVGTYIWVLKGKCPNGDWFEKKGTVFLAR